MKLTALLMSAALLTSAPALAFDAAVPPRDDGSAPASARSAASTSAASASGPTPSRPGDEAERPTLMPVTVDREEERDRWTTVAVVTVLATAVIAVATGALLASYTPPCDASLGCTRAP